MERCTYSVDHEAVVGEVITRFVALLKQHRAVDVATAHLIEEMGALDDDELLTFLFWLALAEAQWDYGFDNAVALARVQELRELGHTLTPRRVLDTDEIPERKALLQELLERLSRPNPDPRPMPSIIERHPVYDTGVCLSVALNDGRFGAAIVLAQDRSDPELGLNLIGVLDYCDPNPPALEVFEARRWLFLTHHNWNSEQDLGWYGPLGHESKCERFAEVGHTEIREDDPQKSTIIVGWSHLGQQVLFERAWRENGGRPEKKELPPLDFL